MELVSKPAADASRSVIDRNLVLIIFLAVETVGYIGRILSAKQNPGPYTEGPYIFQTVLLLVAPAVLAASIYMELGRIVLMLHADSKLFIRRTWLTKIFVAGDVFSFFLQACGAGLQASGKTSTINTGKDVLVGGLFLQVIVFGLFVVAAAVFHKRIKKAPTPKCSETQWSRHMFGLYLISLLIFARSIVRVVEFLQGFTGYIITHEAFLYVFDGLLMFLAVAIMLWVHPSEVTKEIRAVRTASAEIDYIPVEQGQGAIKMDRVAA